MMQSFHQVTPLNKDTGASDLSQAPSPLMLESSQKGIGWEKRSEFDVGDSLLCEESWATGSREGVHKQDHELSMQP